MRRKRSRAPPTRPASSTTGDTRPSVISLLAATVGGVGEYIVPASDLERRLLLECIEHRLVHTSRANWYWSLAPGVSMGERGFSEDGSVPGFVTFEPADDSACPGWAVVLHVRFRALWQHHAVEVEWRLVEDEAAGRACESVTQHSWTRNPPKLRYELRRALETGAAVEGDDPGGG